MNRRKIIILLLIIIVLLVIYLCNYLFIKNDRLNETQEILEYFDEVVNDVVIDDAEDDKIEIKNEINYQNYTILGKLIISKINLEYPILDKATVSNLYVSIAKQWGVNPNNYGTMVIVGHNMNNNLFFSRLNGLNVGDPIIVIDPSGRAVEYRVYDIYETDANDTSHLITAPALRQVILTTCNHDGTKRLVIKSKENI